MDNTIQNITFSSENILKHYNEKYSLDINLRSIYGKPDMECIKLAKLLSVNKDKSRVLDLGCGDGRNLIVFAKSGYNKIVGVDFCRAGIERAKKLIATLGVKNIPKFVVSDIRKYKLGEERYDIIICSEVLQQMRRKEVEDTIDKIKQAVKKGGYVFIRLCSDLERKLPDGRLFIYEGEANYSSTEAKNLLYKKFGGWDIIHCSLQQKEKWFVIPESITSLSPYKKYYRKDNCIKLLAQKVDKDHEKSNF